MPRSSASSRSCQRGLRTCQANTPKTVEYVEHVPKFISPYVSFVLNWLIRRRCGSSPTGSGWGVVLGYCRILCSVSLVFMEWHDPPKGLFCMRCGRDEAERFCKTCLCWVCDERCWPEDHINQCWDCVPQRPQPSPNAEAGVADEAPPPPPWYDYEDEPWDVMDMTGSDNEPPIAQPDLA